MSADLEQIEQRRVREAFDKAAPNYDDVAVLQQTVTDRITETFEFLDIDPKLILDIGSGTGYGSRSLKEQFKKSRIYQLDLSLSMLQQSRQRTRRFFSKDAFVCASAQHIPFNNDQFDIVFSSLMLQWCSDLDSVFREVFRTLKPGGLFIFSTFGPDSLKELRESWRAADEDIHVNTFIDMHDIGDAMIRHGLYEPVLSVEHIQLVYDDVKKLMRELKQIGANNINPGRRKSLTGKSRMQKVMNHYETFRVEKKLPATYEVIYGHAWKTKPSGRAAQDNNEQIISVETLRQQLQGKKKRASK